MIAQHFYLKKYSWEVVVLYNVNENDTDYIKKVLSKICDDYGTIQDGVKYIRRGDYNSGFIYSNFDRKCSLIVIGKADSTEQLFNTIAHEANHLQSHIATKYNLDEKGEEVSYLLGTIIQTMYREFRHIILK